MFSLRQKLLLGFGGLLLVIGLIGIQGITKVTDLSDAIDVILRENYRSVIACQNIKESLERMDSGTLFILLGDEAEGKDEIDRNVPVFEKALQVELQNITLPGEGEKAARLRQLWLRYRSTLQYLEKNTASHTRRHVYFHELFPLFRSIKDTADQILSVNQQNMYEANQVARRKAAAARQHMYVLLFLGAAVAASYVLLIGKWILQPIQRLTRSVDEIKKGNLDLVVTSDANDEIGHLSEAFNDMMASLRMLRRNEAAKLFRIQQSTQQTFNNLPDVVAIVDPEGTVEMATETAKDIFGLKRNVQIRSLPFKWLVDLFENTLENDTLISLKERQTVIQHFVNAEEHYFRPKAEPILDTRKQLTGVILILKDITEQMQQDELKRGVIATVSHQLMTPLTSVRMAVHLLLEEKVGALNPKQAELLIVAREDSERLHRILENLLDISRIESGKIAMEIHPVSPHEIILEARESFRAAALNQGVELKSELPGDVPDVWADRVQIGHVLANLLSNALRHTAPGGRVILSAQADAGQVRFSVSDTGKGIPAQYLPQIFSPFFRVPGQAAETGTGLGLAIAKDIVEAHGGSISVESREGKGSTFFFTLPHATGTSKDDYV